MSRRHVTFQCQGEQLVGTIDGEDAAVGLLIVSGGNEIRSGAFGGQAALAARLAELGFAVMRFDRRGIGDSEGQNSGFRGSAEDIRAAQGEFRRQCPSLTRIVAFGNCDAASALMLMGGEGFDHLILSNPWIFEDEADDAAPPPPDAIRARYAQRLRDPKQVLRLFTGKVNAASLKSGIKAALSRSEGPSELLTQMQRAMRDSAVPHTFLAADNDRTGRAFASAWAEDEAPVRRCEGASHAYVEDHAREWLDEQILGILLG
ncbi:hydrolase 1, exosortase A system-associated [Aurantiacibacter sediminis]|uniref:Hydrolase 1, exosortase A system-associated n=1 Tax=Aurantiacibacter sediminis TaxID=2793064 RepID=A0ABS0N465_9SPHN|nr:hydrolase 1, exosortase A system-associated [Aurantiacibacter sediminis]MBH5322775.1 hydrolase 1, exosortase A system-associated [Aurantiacibacter sediminis]